MFGLGLGKPRTDFGYWCDENGISQLEIAEITGLSRNTISRLCNDAYYEPHENTLIKLVSGLRKHGYRISIGDFW